MYKLFIRFIFLVYFIFFQTHAFAAESKKEIVVVYGIGGKGDKSFNDAMFVGVQKVRKYLKVNVIEVEPLNQFDALNQYEKYAQLNNSLIVSLGFENIDSFQKIAKKYPNSKFAYMDELLNGSNIANFVFREQEGSYLVGYLAAKFSKTKKIGFVGGMDIPPIKRFFKGFDQGAKAALPSIEVVQNFIGTNSNAWLNPSAAKFLSRKQYAKGVDIIYAVSGGSNLGVFEAAKEAKMYAIGVDVNQNGFAPGFIITSMEKRIDNVLYNLAKSYLEDKFKPGTYSNGLNEEGVDIAIDENSNKILPVELIQEMQKLKMKIISGEVIIK